MENLYRNSLVPVILGGTWHTVLLSLRWFFRYHVPTYVLSESFHPAFCLAFAVRFRRVSARATYSDFLMQDLCQFSVDHPDRIVVLVPGNDLYRSFLTENREVLEKFFILSDDDLSFLSLPQPDRSV